MGVDVVVHLADKEHRHRTEDSDRRAEEHAHRERPTLVLCRQNQEDKEEREGEDRRWRNPLRRKFFLKRHPEVIEAHALWHRLLECLLERLHHLAGADAGGAVDVDLGAVIHVEAHHEFGTSDLLHLQEA